MKKCLALSLLFLLVACGTPQIPEPPITEEPPTIKPPAEEETEAVAFQFSLVSVTAVDADGNDISVEGLPIQGSELIIKLPEKTE